MKGKIFTFLVLFCYASLSAGLNAQRSGTIVMEDVERAHFRKEILIPDIAGYLTLKCDFHMHTVFSDGNVWPTVRVDEAWEDGLDAISITDHIEGHPKKLPGQKHNGYEIALPSAQMRDIILIKGGEISRNMPPGHFNALFVSDVNALDLPDYMDALGEAVRQGGFVIWNHPGWRRQQPDTTKWMPEHEDIHRKGWMHGIEVFNEKEWYPEAIQWALEKDLAITGHSDIHESYNYKYNTDLYPVRPLTLVFARERSEASIKEAMFARRTATLFFNRLVGKKEFIDPLVSQSVKVEPSHFSQDGYLYFNIRNSSDIEFTFLKESADSSELPARFVLPRRGTLVLRAKQVKGKAQNYLYRLENVLTGIEEYPFFTITVK
ncbi:MAG: Sb-PDE family phosphodiesterase [Bacteroidales bacterium]